ncbi:MAG: redoxin domain-containing protein [Draconibacterium sp.]|nr:redoxin domain-containing protein [Draconibacterium sp.]
MTFNRIIFILFTAAIFFSGCQKNNQFTINGKITHAEGDTIYLEELLVSSTVSISEIKINKDGEFKLQGETGIPTYYLLKLNNNIITLLIDSIENIKVEADVANFSKDYNVEGSPGSILVKNLIVKLNATEYKIDSLESLDKLYKGNTEYKRLRAQWDLEYDNIIKEQKEFSKNFVLENPFSMASVYALYQQFRKDGSYVIGDLQTMRTAASALNSIYPGSDHVKALYQNTLDELENERAVKVQQYIEEQGANCPEIVLPDLDGKDIALSSLSGKVVLLQFWDAEDRGSRIVNSVLVEAYKKYKRKGLEIYQVSVGTNRIEWVDAIDKDKLSWINVGDMEGSIQAVNVYNVQQIPFNYLLDRDGVIVGKNLNGPALDKALARILN